MRVTPDDVRALYPTSIDPLPAILIASSLTDLYFATSTYTEELKSYIELNWACHILTGIQTAGGVVETRLGDSSIRYSESKIAVGLQSSRFGELVLLLDKDHIIAASQAAEAVAVTPKPASFFID